ncbi:AAA family ATPase [Streptomyces phaeochromogenes]|uniref:AAA family ATPase n=1 Tax=Streptomyces phaeochromogenes TaxID=1923 RepID=UPI003713413F
MTRRDAAAAGRRYVVAVGTTTYTDEALPELPGVAVDVSTVTTVLRGLRNASYESAVFPDGRLDPVLPPDVLGPLSDWLAAPSGRGNDTVIVYYSGHGVNDDRLYLAMKDTRSLNPVGTALPVDDLIRCFFKGGGTQLLLIVDACYAALGGIDAIRAAAEATGRMLSGAPGADPRDLVSFAVISAARGRAQDSAFSAAFAHALAPKDQASSGVHGPPPEMAGYLAPYLRVQDVVDRINADFADQQLMQRASAHIGIHSGSVDFFPNPDYKPGLPQGLDRAEQLTWIGKSAREFFTYRGTASDGDVPTSVVVDRFQGRGDILSDLSDWLRTPASAAPQVTVVTGSAGVGKSAVLGRLITRSDPATRHLIPDTVLTVAADLPAGTFDLVIHARHISLRQVTDALAQAVALPGGQLLEQLAEALDRSPRPLTVALDALDEAGPATDDSGAEGRRIAGYLADLVARTTQLRLLIGTRPHLRDQFTHLAGRARTVDLDDARWTSYADLTAYAEHLLQHPHGTGSSTVYTPADANRIGGTIARRAFPNYLITRLTARVLAQQLPSAGTDWEDHLPASNTPDAATTAFRWALATHLDDNDHIRDLLRPLAYAEGPGLPARRIWPALATAFVGHPVTDIDLAGAISSKVAGAYVVETLDSQGRSVFRLAHQALADDLRLDAPAGTQQRLINALLSCVPRAADGTRDWPAADPYLLHHLPSHAANAKQLEALLDDPGFLAHIPPSALLPVLDQARTVAGRLVADIYRTTLGDLRRSTPDTRRWYLALGAARFGAHDLTSLLHPPGPRQLWPRWSTGTPDPALRDTLTGHEDQVWALSCAEVSGRPVAVTGGLDGTIRMWDLTHGEPIGQPQAGHDPGVTAVACTVLGGRPAAVTSGYDGTMRVWDLLRWEPIGSPFTGHDPGVTAVACTVLGGRPAAVSGHRDGTVRVWDLTRQEPIGHPMTGHEGGVKAVACTVIGGRPVAVTSGDDGMRMWDLTRQEPIGHPMTGHEGGIGLVACTVLEGRAVAVTGGSGYAVRLWDLARQEQLGQPLTGHRGTVWAVACAEMNGRSIALIGGDTVRAWDLARREPIGPPMADRRSTVHVVAYAVVDGRPVAVTGNDDATVRVWDLTRREWFRPLMTSHRTYVRDMACAVANGRPVAVTGGGGDTMRVWDLDRGKQLGPPMTSSDDTDILGITCAVIEDRPVAITSSLYGTMQVWDLSRRELLGPPMPRPRPRWGQWRVTCAVLNGRPVALAYGEGRKVWVWDLIRRERLGLPLGGHRGGVEAVACAVVDGRTVAVTIGSYDGTIRVWDLIRREQLGPPLAGGRGGVEAVACAVVDGHPVAITGGGDGTVRVWDLTRKEPLNPPLNGHKGEVSAVACVVVDGRPVAITGGEDRTVRVWDLTQRKEVLTLPFPASVGDVAVSEDGALVVQVGSDIVVLAREGEAGA